MVNRYMKKFLPLIREVQVKTTKIVVKGILVRVATIKKVKGKYWLSKWRKGNPCTLFVGIN